MKTRMQNKINNRGSALVLVVVVIAFVSILVTTILYVSGMNYKMKSTDYHTKVSFYGAEIPLEELRQQLAVDVSRVSEKAYQQVMFQYGNLPSADLRKQEYQTLFFEEYRKLWRTRNTDPTDASITDKWMQGIASVLSPSPHAAAYEVIEAGTPHNDAKSWHIEVNPGEIMVEDAAKGRLVINNIKVVYTENSYTSEIVTSFCIDVPPIAWSVDQYQATWDATILEAPAKINFENCVNYLNWSKQ